MEQFVGYFKSIREKVSEIAQSNKDLGIDPEDLSCGCGLASWLVFSWLRERGLNPFFVACDFHSWVRCDGYSIDLTATQFDMSLPEVLIVETGRESEYPNFNFSPSEIEEYCEKKTERLSEVFFIFKNIWHS